MRTAIFRAALARLLLAAPLLAAMALLPLAPALADGEVGRLMTAADKKRLAAYAETRRQALAEARAGAPADRAVLDALVAKPALPFGGFDMTGAWQCRTIKVGGGLSPLVVYGWFKCRVSDDGAGWMLEKTSGSQRTKGRFYDDGSARLIYLGSFYVAGEQPPRYGAGPKSDQVGYAFRTGPRSFRIELPAPAYESRLDLVELKR